MKRLVLPCALALAFAAASCVKERPAPSPALPPPPPPKPQVPASGPAQAPPAAKRAERPPPPLSKPSFSVLMLEKSGEKRTQASEESLRAVNLLVMSGYEARAAEPPADLPSSRIEAAQKAASLDQGPRADKPFLFGETTRGETTDVKVTAIEPRDGKVIDDQGFRSPTAPTEKLVERASSALLPTIETYWRIRK